MRLFFAGAEIPSHRKVLTEVEAPTVALSFMGLRRRIKHTDRWILDEKFPEAVEILVDSGAYTVNRDVTGYTARELYEISDEYQAFVAANIDRVEAVIEFDALALGKEWIESQREDFYDDLPPEKFVPVWHPEWGTEYLNELAEKYSRIGIPTTDLSGRNLAPLLNGMAQKGIRLHGVAMTHVDQMSEIRWDSVSSTSWISPQQYGDTIVWTGRELKRYPKKYKEQARKRHRMLFEREGFDAEKIENDDSTEVLRLSVWSWTQLVSDIDKKHNRGLHVVTNSPEGHDSPFAEVEGEEVDTQTGEVRKKVSTEVATVKHRETVPLPVLSVTSTKEEYEDEQGEKQTRDISNVSIRSDSQRKCATCFLASKCPAFEPNSNCAYDIPLRIQTKSDFINLQNAMIEMQAQRVMFMRMAEELDGGYADPNLSTEVDRLNKLMKTKSDMEQEGFSFKIEGKQVGPGTGQPGMLARLFGDQASKKAQELPGGPVHVESAMDVIDAEWSEER